jgi:hypothetical protein
LWAGFIRSKTKLRPPLAKGRHKCNVKTPRSSDDHVTDRVELPLVAGSTLGAQVARASAHGTMAIAYSGSARDLHSCGICKLGPWHPLQIQTHFPHSGYGQARPCPGSALEELHLFVDLWWCPEPNVQSHLHPAKGYAARRRRSMEQLPKGCAPRSGL